MAGFPGFKLTGLHPLPFSMRLLFAYPRREERIYSLYCMSMQLWVGGVHILLNCWKEGSRIQKEDFWGSRRGGFFQGSLVPSIGSRKGLLP